MTDVMMEWEGRLGRRLRVRDLYILSTVVKSGTMGKAARALSMSQPAVSEAVANLEHLLGVRLLDRSPRGIEPTIYAAAMLKRTTTVFDELKQGVRDIQSLADPTMGEVSIGYSNMIAATVFPKIIETFSEKYPRVVMHVDLVPSPSSKFLPGLRDRTFDLIFARLSTQVVNDPLMDDVSVEFLFDDPLVVVVGAHSRWVCRRKIDLADLIGEPWILSPPKTWSYERVAEAFKARGLCMPTAGLLTYSMDLRTKLSAHGRFITVVPSSVLRLDSDRHSLKMLPVNMPMRPWPVSIVTLKNRTLGPVAERFIASAREVANSVIGRAGRPPSVRGGFDRAAAAARSVPLNESSSSTASAAAKRRRRRAR